MKEIARVVVFSLFFLSVVAHAESKPAPSVTSGAAATKVVQSAQAITIPVEVLLLKEQNKLIKEFQSAQQATVYWALSGILGFVVVLMGLSYFTNFKFYEQDKDRLKAEFEGRLNTSRAEMNLQIEEAKRELEVRVQQNNQLIQDRTLAQLSEARLSVDNIRTELTSEIKLIDKGVVDARVSLESFNRQMSNLESELREVEMEVWEVQGIPTNMLLSLGQALRAAKSCENTKGVTRMLKKMLVLVDNKFIKEGETIRRRVLELVLADLDFAGVNDVAMVEKLKSSLAKIPLEPEVS